MSKFNIRKVLVCGIILLFVGASVFPSTVSIIEKKIAFTGFNSRGYIQDLIDNASTGDTIYIPSGTYYENIVINKSINFVGEDKETTIIDGGGNGNVIWVSADWVNISRFTIRNGDTGINMSSNFNTITGNNISNNGVLGLLLVDSNNNTIASNIITSNYEEGIYLIDSNDNNITRNTISENEDGIELEDSNSNTINENNISSNYDYGIEVITSSGEYCINNIITGNNIISNIHGIYFENSSSNTNLKNNFINNQQHAFFINGSNTWKQNYWNRPRLLPKLIFGKIEIGSKEIPWVNIDWRPAKKPYDIPQVAI